MQLEANERRIMEQQAEDRAALLAEYEQGRADLVAQHQQDKEELIAAYEARIAEEALTRDLEAQASREVHEEAAVR